MVGVYKGVNLKPFVKPLKSVDQNFNRLANNKPFNASFCILHILIRLARQICMNTKD